MDNSRSAKFGVAATEGVDRLFRAIAHLLLF
jgi:hypothetical protein